MGYIGLIFGIWLLLIFNSIPTKKERVMFNYNPNRKGAMNKTTIFWYLIVPIITYTLIGTLIYIIYKG